MGRYAVLAMAVYATACRRDFDAVPRDGAPEGLDRDAALQAPAFRELTAAECACPCVCTPTAMPFVVAGCTNIASGATAVASLSDFGPAFACP
jgi:hypothetical protein